MTAGGGIRPGADALTNIKELFTMNLIHRYALVASLVAAFAPGAFASTQLQEELYEKVLSGTMCKQTKSNGLICEYKVGDLSISIKDAGGTDTVVGFNHSDVSDEHYAVWYFGCIVVVPGHRHVGNYGRDYGIYISPINGRAYRTKIECAAVR